MGGGIDWTGVASKAAGKASQSRSKASKGSKGYIREASLSGRLAATVYGLFVVAVFVFFGPWFGLFAMIACARRIFLTTTQPPEQEFYRSERELQVERVQVIREFLDKSEQTA